MSKTEIEMLRELLVKFWNEHEWPHPTLSQEPYDAIQKRIDEVLAVKEKNEKGKTDARIQI